MNLYQNNAFRVLGLLTNATTSQVVARVNEIRVKSTVDFHEGYEFDFPWLGPLDRSEENVSAALQRLEDPVRRIKQELSWFWLQTENDRQAINALSRRDLKSALEIWLKTSGLTLQQLIQIPIAPLNTPEALTALHNIFILFQATLLRNELMAKEDTVIVLLENISKDEEHWAVALRVFNFLHDQEKYWDLVKKRMSAMEDRRVQNISLQEIKESSLNNALAAHFFLITKALGSKDISMLDKHIEILENANMPADVYKSGLNQVLYSRIESMNSLCEDFLRERKVVEDKGDPSVYKNLFYKFRDSAKSLIDDCQSVDRKGLTDFVLSREKYAKSFQQLSWKLNKTGDSLGALESMSEAYKNLYSDALKLECEKDAERMIQDAVMQLSTEATRLINPLQGQITLEEVIKIKDQYITNIRSLFTTGGVFLTDQLQKLLRDLVVKELKLIAVEVQDKYQAYENADNIMREAIEWADEANKEEFKKELEGIKQDWVRKAGQKKPGPVNAFKVSREAVLALAAGVIIFISAVLAIRNASAPVAAKIPVPPVKASSGIMTGPTDPGKNPSGNIVEAKSTATVSAALSGTAGLTTREGKNDIENSAPVVVQIPVSQTQSDLLAEASKFKAEIEVNKSKIKVMENELEIRRRVTDSRQSDIDRLDNKIGTNPDSPDYNAWVNEHNDLVREQNQYIQDSKEIYKKYQDEFKHQQDLISNYNEKFAR